MQTASDWLHGLVIVANQSSNQALLINVFGMNFELVDGLSLKTKCNTVSSYLFHCYINILRTQRNTSF